MRTGVQVEVAGARMVRETQNTFLLPSPFADSTWPMDAMAGAALQRLSISLSVSHTHNDFIYDTFIAHITSTTKYI